MISRILVTFASCGLLAAQTQVTLSSPTTPPSGTPGLTNINVTGSGFPSGTILPSATNVTLQPSSGTGPSATVAATAVTTVVGSSRRVTFTIPSALAVTVPTAYLVSISGSTTTAIAFASSNKASLTLNPPATISNVNPNSAQQGQQNVAVTITGQFTSFVNGATKASFGAGISVGGAAAGTLGPVTVVNATTANASLNVAPDAATGTRTISVQTGAETPSLVNGFTVQPGTPVLLSVTPASGQPGQSLPSVSIVGQFTHFVNGTSIATFGAGITVNSTSVTDSTHATANITIQAGAALGARTVIVTTATETASSAAGAFTVNTPGGPSISDFNPKSGPIGTPVTVTGSNFGSSPQVTMAKLGGGTIAAPTTAASSTSVTFAVPAGATSGVITIANGGTTASTATPFNVTPSAGFTVGVTPPSANLIQGKSVAYSVQLATTTGFDQLTQLGVTGVPAGVTASFSPQKITVGQTSMLTLTAPANQAPGTTGLTITATATVDSLPVTPSASASLSVVPPTTTLLGRTVISDSLETPLAGVTVTALGKDGNGGTTGCTGTTISDGAGNFSLTNLPSQCAGPQLIGFDGTTATAPPGKYAGVNLVFTFTSGQVTVSPVLVHLPRIDNVETFLVQQNAPANQSHAFTSIPGLSVTVYAGTIFTMPDGSTPNPFPLAAVQVPVDRLPDAKPNVPTMIRTFIVAFQPANANTNQPVAVFYPNVLNTPAGTNMVLMTLDPTHGTMVPYGTGSVSADQTSIVPDADPAHPGHLYGLLHFDWHGPMPPPPPGPPPPPPDPPDDGPPCDDCPPVDGGPIDLSSGIGTTRSVDLAIKGSLRALRFTRVMSTIGTTAGPFGIAGSHNFDLRLDSLTVGSAATTNLVLPNGARVRFSRQPDGTMINTTDPALAGAVITTTTPGNTASLRFRTGLTWNFVPSGSLFGAVLGSISDPNGNVTSLTRNPSAMNQILAISDPSGRQLLFTYDTVGAGRITRITDPVGRAVNYTYAASGYLATFTDANGGVWQYTSDAQARLVSIRDPRGVLTEQNTYDTNSRVVSQIQADGNAIQFSYTLTNPLAGTSPVMITTVTDQLGRQTVYRFNPLGYLIQVIDPAGQSRLLNRQAGTNLLLGYQGPGVCRVCGDTTMGDIALTYDARGNLLTRSNSLGNTRQFTYDTVFSRVTSETDPLGNITRYQYDANGNVTGVTDPRGNQITIAVGAFGLPASITDAAHQTTSFQYNANGDLISVQDPLANKRTFGYDTVSRRVSSSDAFGAQFSYAYDPLDRPVRQTDAQGGITLRTYDAVGNLLSVTDPRGGRNNYTYDSLSRLTQRTDPLSRSESFSYDAVSNQTAHTDRRGQPAAMGYDSLNRLLSETYSDATVSRTYDANGRLLQVNDSQGGVFTFAYDSAGQLLHSAAPSGAITYARDAKGRMSSRQAAGQSLVNYQYDPASNLTQASMPQATIGMSYDARNAVQGITRSNGVTSAITYDSLNRTLSIAHQAGVNILANFSYTYDPAGNRASASTNLAQALTTQTAAGAFDADNAMTSFGGRSFVSDNNGNRLSETGPGGTTTYAWDGRNRLRVVTQPGGVTTQFTYDFNRNLIQQSVTNGATTTTNNYLVDQYANVVAIVGGANPVSLLTGPSVDSHYATVDSLGQVQFALTDALGSVAGNSGSAATLTGTNMYEPFGQTTTTGTNFPFAFTGRSQVPNSLYYYRNRYYDPVAGRFLSEDTIGIKGGDYNFYRYAGNRVTRLTDPFGLICSSFNPWNPFTWGDNDNNGVSDILEWLTGSTPTPLTPVVGK